MKKTNEQLRKKINSKEFYEFVLERCEVDSIKAMEIINYLNDDKN